MVDLILYKAWDLILLLAQKTEVPQFRGLKPPDRDHSLENKAPTHNLLL